MNLTADSALSYVSRERMFKFHQLSITLQCYKFYNVAMLHNSSVTEGDSDRLPFHTLCNELLLGQSVYLLVLF